MLHSKGSFAINSFHQAGISLKETITNIRCASDHFPYKGVFSRVSAYDLVLQGAEIVFLYILIRLFFRPRNLQSALSERRGSHTEDISKVDRLCILSHLKKRPKLIFFEPHEIFQSDLFSYRVFLDSQHSTPLSESNISLPPRLTNDKRLQGSTGDFMANLAGRNPFLALDDMDIGIAPGFTLTDQEKALDAASIIHAAYKELGASPSDLDSGIAAALANRSIAGAKVTVGANWTAAVMVGSKTQSGVSLTTPKTLADFASSFPPPSPDAWQPQFVTELADTDITIHYTMTNPVGVGLTIVWGDGQTQTLITGSSVNHTYASAGTYNVQIIGSATQINFSGQSTLKAILAPLQGIVGITSVASIFIGCANLTDLPADLFRYLPTVKYFSNVFYNCAGLTTLPADLFRYNTEVTYFASAFDGCTGLTSVPTDMFKYNTAPGLNFSGAFNGCINLTTLPLMPWHA